MPEAQVVVIGGSAGGIQALSELLGRLPGGFPAAVFVTLHLSSRSQAIPGILDRAGPLPVRFAEDGEPVVGGEVRIAPPDQHMLLVDGHVRLGRGPRENRSRPAIDPLFRSAARAYGEGALAVVLSGALSDGSAGLTTIEQAGGIALVQSPDDALVASMPRAAIAHDAPRHVGTAAELAEHLVRYAVPPRIPPAATALTTDEESALLVLRPFVPPEDARASGYSCPACGGVLWEPADESPPALRCRVGHAFVVDDLLAEQQITIEGALWTAVRTLEEQADLAERLAKRATDHGHEHVAARFEQRTDDCRQASLVLAELLRGAPWAGA